MMALTPINLGSAPNDGKGDNLRTAGSKINANFVQLTKLEFDTVAALLANSSLGYGSGAGQVAAGDVIRTRKEDHAYEIASSGARDHHVQTSGGVKLYVLPGSDGFLPAVAFGYVANNNQSAAAGNYIAVDNALRAGSALGRLVAIPPGIGYTNRGWHYENDNYRGTGLVGIGARGKCVIKFADTLAGSAGINVWMFNLNDASQPNPFNFTLKNVALDGNRTGNRADAATAFRMEQGFAEHVLLEDVDTYSFYTNGRMLMGGLTENAVVDRNGRSWDIFERHGFATRGDMKNFGTHVVFENPVAWKCGGHCIDISRGRAIIRGVAEVKESTGSITGNIKISSDGSNNFADSLIADTIISKNPTNAGFWTTGDPYCDIDIKRYEGSGSVHHAFLARFSRSVKLGTVILKKNLFRDMELRCDTAEIDVLDVSDGAFGDASGTNHQLMFWGPLRYLRIGKLIAHNNRSRVMIVRPESSVPVPTTTVEIGYLELVNNNRDNHGSNYLIEVNSQEHPVHMRIRDGVAYDTRATPRQTRIFRAAASSSRAARIDIDRFVFGAGAQSGSRISTSGTGASITVGESIGV
jgi:hypothetical protein